MVQKLVPVIVGNPVVLVCKKLTNDNRVHDTNAFVTIVVTDAGIVTEVRATHLLNAPSPIDVSPDDNVTEARLLQK